MSEALNAVLNRIAGTTDLDAGGAPDTTLWDEPVDGGAP